MTLDEEKEWLDRSFWTFATGGVPQELQVFKDHVLRPLIHEFDIPNDLAAKVQGELDCGAQAFLASAQRAKDDSAELRKQLETMRKSAEKLRNLINEAPPEVWQLLNNSAAGRTLGGAPYPRIRTPSNGTDVLSKPALEFRKDGSDDIARFDMSALCDALDAISECTTNAKKFAGQGKRGRPENNGLYYLMIQTYQAWAWVLEREFRLDWTDDRKPITPAARFAVAVAHAVDPTLPDGTIANAAIKARDLGKKTRHLEEPPEIVEFFFKRLE